MWLQHRLMIMIGSPMNHHYESILWPQYYASFYRINYQIRIQHQIHVIFKVDIAQLNRLLHLISFHQLLASNQLLPHTGRPQQIAARMDDMATGGEFLDFEAAEDTWRARAVTDENVAGVGCATEDFSCHWPEMRCKVKFSHDIVPNPLWRTCISDFKSRKCKSVSLHKMHRWMDME